MINDLKQSLYLKEMMNFSYEFSKYMPFIFYGSLLGICRDENIINGDDDIDFLVNFDFKNEILSEIIFSNKFIIDYSKSNNFFTSIYLYKKKIRINIDLYFYTDNLNDWYIIDRHNFFGEINDKKKNFYIPKKLIFPLKKNKIFNYIFLPNSAEKLCEFLYGSDWKIPLKKNVMYKMTMSNNRPILIKLSFLSSLIRSLKIFLKKYFNLFNKFFI